MKLRILIALIAASIAACCAYSLLKSSKQSAPVYNHYIITYRTTNNPPFYGDAVYAGPKFDIEAINTVRDNLSKFGHSNVVFLLVKELDK